MKLIAMNEYILVEATDVTTDSIFNKGKSNKFKVAVTNKKYESEYPVDTIVFIDDRIPATEVSFDDKKYKIISQSQIIAKYEFN